ncbi:hypothetical protein CNMCM5793_001628 [Aspergillus hiratsukae]|uniref:Nucleoside phosphorylase domain-containing protein n=1 Tax=Aspergillus hiratsukae TaxID=1194566 RepID=A0A8H6PC74_9EURO|nr:hypothetical protein CNMCM5793_001628 [Aspergillus hiratsukae]KAF7165157.1 hypothetical protein CNMCM6106_001397 [Aspergillus hiratsukae]
MPTPHAYSRPRDRNAFEVAIICALTVEADAVITLFDDFWERDEQYEKVNGDANSYTIGRLGQHHVVLVHMYRMGKVPAANVAANLRSSFPRIRLGVLVGICGGVPFIDGGKAEIILGDIVISTQIVPTDFGRQYSDSFVRKDTSEDNLGKPSPEIGGFLMSLQNRAAQIKLEDHIRSNLVTIFDLTLSPSSMRKARSSRSILEPMKTSSLNQLTVISINIQRPVQSVPGV